MYGASPPLHNTTKQIAMEGARKFFFNEKKVLRELYFANTSNRLGVVFEHTDDVIAFTGKVKRL